jgi:putative ABC transport system permease protein
MFVALRTAGDPVQATAAVRRVVTELDPELPLHAIATMKERIALTVAQPKLAATLTSAFAIATLILAAIGVYGVVSYGVAQRTRELGVRMALGADAGDVRMLVLRQAMTPVAIGIAVGLLGAWAGGRLLQQLLYGVGATDVATFAGTALFLAAVAALSAWLPARRATAIAPTEALRYE